MATTTPNYGWTVPTSTDLVKDGATAIETLGDAIDASMNTALGTKKAGMVLLNTTSFSAVASQALPANTFSATYSNYKILIRATGSSGSGVALNFKLLDGVTDKSTGYYGNSNFMIYTSSTVNGGVYNNATSLQISSLKNSHHNYVVLEVGAPYIAGKTIMLSHDYGGDDYNTLARAIQGDTGGVFDSANFIAASGTMTGAISVYGYSV
jgi:hypothetical protein